MSEEFHKSWNGLISLTRNVFLFLSQDDEGQTALHYGKNATMLWQEKSLFLQFKCKSSMVKECFGFNASFTELRIKGYQILITWSVNYNKLINCQYRPVYTSNNTVSTKQNF